MTRDESMERGLKAAFQRRGATPCPGEGPLLAFYGGGLDEARSEAIREHLAGCASCVELALDARAFVETMSAPAAEAGPGSRMARWLAAAAALLVAAGAGLWLTRQRPAAPAPVVPAAASRPSDLWRDLPVAAAAYRPPSPEDELVFRSGEGADGREFAEAMVPYTKGDYRATEAGLARFLEKHPGHADASFYRGVCLLMLGKPEQARPLLASAAASRRAAKEARWYLALALVKSGDAAAALGKLDAVVRSRGPHRDEAARLAEEIRASGSR